VATEAFLCAVQHTHFSVELHSLADIIKGGYHEKCWNVVKQHLAAVLFWWVEAYNSRNDSHE